MSTVATQAQPVVADYQPIQAELQQLRDTYKGRVFDLSKKDEEAEARKARSACVKARVTLEAARKKAKEASLETGRRIDATAKSIEQQITEVEKPIDAQIKAKEAREEEARLAKVKAERERVDKIEALVRGLRDTPGKFYAKSLPELAEAVDSFSSLSITQEIYQEFLEEAKAAHAGTLAQLQTMLDAQIQREAEVARLKQEKAETEAKAKVDREAEAAEWNRIEKIRSRIDTIRQTATLSNLQQILGTIAVLETTEIDESFEEFVSEAAIAKSVSLGILKARRDSALKAEEDRKAVAAEQAKLKADREALELEKAALPPKPVEEITVVNVEGGSFFQKPSGEIGEVATAAREFVERAAKEFQETGIAPAQSDSEKRAEEFLPDLFQLVADFDRTWKQPGMEEPSALVYALIPLAERAEELMKRILIG